MNAKIPKWGNSLALKIPSTLAHESNLTQGCRVDLQIIDGKLVVETQLVPQYELDNLLGKVTGKNIHKEVSTGKHAGREAL